jgi:hypothetical protein
MKTPFTDAATLIVHAGGKALPVTPASVAQLLERRLNQLEFSQDVAWGIIKLADWNNQSLEWKEAAREWQEDIYVHKELSLTYSPTSKVQDPLQTPTNLPDALKLIAELRTENHKISTKMNQLDAEISALEKAIESLETKYHEAVHTARSIQRN